MPKVFRLAAYFVLLTFVLSLGDWPFVDEIFEAETQVQQEVAAVESNTVAKADIDMPAKASPSLAYLGLYQALSNFVDMPAHRFPLNTATKGAHVIIGVTAYASVDPEPFERPPKTLPA